MCFRRQCARSSTRTPTLGQTLQVNLIRYCDAEVRSRLTAGHVFLVKLGNSLNQYWASQSHWDPGEMPNTDVGATVDLEVRMKMIEET